MDLYRISSGDLQEVEHNPFKLEKDIQTLVEQNLETLFKLQFISTEFRISDFRIDTLGFDLESNSFVIIEYKKGHSYSVIDQGYSYLSLMLENKSDFILEYNENTDTPLKRDDVDWSQSKVIFMSQSFNTYQKNSVNFKDVPFELWEIKKFSNDLISLEQYKPSSKDSIESFSTSGSVISNVSSEIKVLNEEDHTSKSTPESLELWDSLKEYFSNLEDTNFQVKKKYISIRKGTKTICYVTFLKRDLKIDIIRGTSYPDGTVSKKYFTIDDPKNVCIEREFSWKNGNKGGRYKMMLNSKTKLDYIQFLIKQKYDSI